MISYFISQYKKVVPLLSLMMACCFLLVPSISFAQDNVVLQLKWKHAFQFAGYYAAQELGYYDDVGLDVDIRAASPGVDPVEEVLKGKAQYGIGNSALLLDRQNGKPVVVLSVVFQHSPAILITKGDGRISSVKDFVGKRVMIEPNSLELLTYLKKEGIPPEKIQIIDHSYDVNDLIQGDIDALSAYSSNEPYLLNQKGYFFKEFTPRGAGIDFYGDNLFTMEDEIRNHPDRVEAFRTASMKGWVYAMENTDEMIELILKKYGEGLERKQLLFESQTMNNLLVNNLIEVGHMNPARWRRIVNAYKSLDLIHKENILEGFIYTPPIGLMDIIRANYTVLLKYLVGSFLLIVFFIYRHHQLHLFNRKLERIAEVDQLTGIYNRKRLDETLGREVERFSRYSRSFSVILVDIDKFKDVNDTYGHQVGDEVLIQVVEILSDRVRTTDTLGRWGGEEFLLICPETEIDAAVQLAEEMRRAVEVQSFATAGHQTISFGVATCGEGDKANDVVKRADDALYQAKNSGRNRGIASVHNTSK
ncbi:MAG: GGDEF domain-containing protein [Cycloclasticus sp.]|nr:GGDEF domain-containing protein [Cycloclasticus sp.]